MDFNVPSTTQGHLRTKGEGRGRGGEGKGGRQRRRYGHTRDTVADRLRQIKTSKDKQTEREADGEWQTDRDR